MTPLREDGRHGGRLTGRPLPEHDPTLDALTAQEREELASHWLARAASERRVADAFEVIRDTLGEAGAPSELVELAHRAIDDEMRHAELARVVASRFAGRPLDAPPRVALVVPAHHGASPELRRALHVVGHCALNETFASAVLEAALAATTGRLASAALRELLADEIDHARIGWGYVAHTDTATRAAIGRWLPRIARENLRAWREADRAYPTEPRLVAHGALSRELLEGALLGALRTLILPGLRHVGLPTAELERWVELGAPTA
jgi:hypothetical protein